MHRDEYLYWGRAMVQELQCSFNGKRVERSLLLSRMKLGPFGWLFSMRKLMAVIVRDRGRRFHHYFRCKIAGQWLTLISARFGHCVVMPFLDPFAGPSLRDHGVYHAMEVCGKGNIWCALVTNTRGTFIGKATVDESWYGTQGHEVYQDESFKIEASLVVVPECRGVHVLQQERYGELWFALAHTVHGNIPGKANRAGVCWYTYGGREYSTTDFVYLAARVADPQSTNDNHDHLSRQELVAKLVWHHLPHCFEKYLLPTDLLLLSCATKHMDMVRLSELHVSLREEMLFYISEYEVACMNVCTTLNPLVSQPMKWPGFHLGHFARLDIPPLGAELRYRCSVEAVWNLSPCSFRVDDYMLQYYGDMSYINVLASQHPSSAVLQSAFDLLRSSVLSTYLYPCVENCKSFTSGLVIVFQCKGIQGSLFVEGPPDRVFFQMILPRIELDPSVEEYIYPEFAVDSL